MSGHSQLLPLGPLRPRRLGLPLHASQPAVAVPRGGEDCFHSERN